MPGRPSGMPRDLAAGIFLERLPAPPPGRAGLLSGLRVGIKDNIDVAGLPSRAGLGRTVPPALRDAPAVAALRAAGAWITGKTVMDEAALGATGDNPHTGQCPNPAAPGRSPGGSSSGSAACVAAGLCDAALGTDTMGSVRIPAAYCGVVGMIPSPGVIPLSGIVPLSPRLDRPGILAANLHTLGLVLGAYAPEPDDARPNPTIVLIQNETLHPAILGALNAAQNAAAVAGWRVEGPIPPEWDPSALRRAALLFAEADGAEEFRSLLDQDDPALSDGARDLLRFGQAASPERLARASAVLDEARLAAHRLLREADLILMPTVAHPAYALTNGPPRDQADWTVMANAAGLPAITLPAGTVPNGMDGADAPVSIQVLAAPGRDHALLRWAKILDLEHSTGRRR